MTAASRLKNRAGLSSTVSREMTMGVTNEMPKGETGLLKKIIETERERRACRDALARLARDFCA